jgi:hypothetical protein
VGVTEEGGVMHNTDNGTGEYPSVFCMFRSAEPTKSAENANSFSVTTTDGSNFTIWNYLFVCKASFTA